MTPAERIAALPEDPRAWSTYHKIALYDALTSYWDDASMKPWLTVEERRYREDEAWRSQQMADHYRTQMGDA